VYALVLAKASIAVSIVARCFLNPVLGDTPFAHDGDASGEDELRVRAGGLRSVRGRD
jgi:hypothetical protein